MSVGSGKRILVVDDEVSITDLVVRVLEGHGFEAWAVNNPLRALDQAVKLKPDLIIVDFIMPQIVGSELCLLIKANPSLRKAPVVFLSGSSEEDHRTLAKISGGAAYLQKPIEGADLVATVCRELGLGDPSP